MNRVYRLIFNRALGVMQVASELASTRVKSRSPHAGAMPSWAAGVLAVGVMVAAPLAWADGGRGGDGQPIANPCSGGVGGAGGNAQSATGGQGGAAVCTTSPVPGGGNGVGGGGGGGGVDLTTGRGGLGGEGGQGSVGSVPTGNGGDRGIGGQATPGTDEVVVAEIATFIAAGGSAGANSPLPFSGAGGGGGGGSYVVASKVTNLGRVFGGAGGAGGTGGTVATDLTMQGGGGGGGEGGVGVVLTGSGQLINSGSITGGQGGAGGMAFAAGAGGDGGVGVAGSGVILNTGLIRGGDAGQGGVSVFGNPAANGASGDAIRGHDLSITNLGQIVAGAGTNPTAIRFTGGANMLDIEGGGISGVVDATAGVQNLLVLGGAGNLHFDMSDVGPTQQYRGFTDFHKIGTGTWTLTGTGDPSIDWLIDAGTLQADTNSVQGNVNIDGSLVFNQSFTGSVAGSLSGTGSLTINGGGFVTLQGNNTYAGSTIIGPNTVVALGTTGTLPSSTDVQDDGQLNLSGNPSGRVTIGSLSGTGTVLVPGQMFTLGAAHGVFSGVLAGAGALAVLSGSETFTHRQLYTGLTNIRPGASVILSDDGSLASSGAVNVDGTLDIQDTTSATTFKALSGAGQVITGVQPLAVSGGSTTFSGQLLGPADLTLSSGAMTFSGVNALTGDIAIGSGASLHLSGGGSISDASDVLVFGVFDLGPGMTNTSIRTLVGSGLVTLGDRTLTLTNANTIFNGTLSAATGQLIVQSGRQTLAGNTAYDGRVVIDPGATLLLAQPSSVADVTHDVVNQGTVGYVTSGLFDVRNDLAGAGGLLATGTGTLQLSGTNSYQGATTIDAGATLSLVGNTSLSSSSNVNDEGILDFRALNRLTLVNNLSGNGSVLLGTGTLVLDGGTFAGAITGNGNIEILGARTNFSGIHSYAGVTQIDQAATLALSGAGSIAASSAVTVVGTLDISGTTSGASIRGLEGSGNVLLGSQTLRLGGLNETFDGVISGSGDLDVGSLRQTFDRVNLYTGTTHVEQGSVLSLGTGSSIAASRDVTVDGQLDLSTAMSPVSLKSLSGQGLVQLGTEDLTLTAANGRFDGGITGLGNVVFGGGVETLGGLSSYSGTTTVAAGATLALASGSSIARSAKVIDNGTLDLSANAAGTQITSLAGQGTVSMGAQTLTLTAASDTFGGVIQGDGPLTLRGGSETFAGNNTYTGSTDIASGAQLSLSGQGSIGQSRGVIVDGTFDISQTTNGASITQLLGSGVVNLGSRTLTLTGGNGMFTGNITGDGGLTIAAGTQTLLGQDTYTGLTTIDPGATLILSSMGTLSGTRGIVNNGALGYQITHTVTQSDPINGTGGLVVDGPGMLQLTAVNGYVGATTIEQGATLYLLGGGSIAQSSDVADEGTFDISAGPSETTIHTLSGSGTVLLGARMLNLDGAHDTFAGSLTGNGGLFVTAGRETFSGTNTYRGETRIERGATLALTGSGSIAVSSEAFVEGLLDLTGAAHDVSLQSLMGAGNVSLGSHALVVTDGIGQFDGVLSGAGGLTVDGGIQTLTNAQAYTGATRVERSGTLLLRGNGQVASSGGLSLDGTLYIDATNAGATLTSLSGHGNIALGSKTLTLTAAHDRFDGTIAGSGGVEVHGSETLSGGSIYTGTTHIDTDATLALVDRGSILSSPVAADGTFDIAATADGASIPSLSGHGRVSLGGMNLTLSAAQDTFAGAMDGTGGLTVAGGSETLSGVLAYTGATDIASGATLALANAGNLAASHDVSVEGLFDMHAAATGTTIQRLSGSGEVMLGANDLTLTNARDTFDGRIEGSGGLVVSGGQQMLTGTQAFTGETTIAQGAGLGLSGNASLSASRGIVNDGLFDITGAAGSVSIANLSGTGQVNLGNHALVLASASDGFAGDIEGTGSLDVHTTGTYRLAAMSGYSGGTTLSQGALVIADDHAIGSGTLAMAPDTRLVLEGANRNLANGITLDGDPTLQVDDTRATLSGVIADGAVPGDVVKTGTGDLVLTADNTYSGGTTVAAGRLQLGDGGTTGWVPGNVAVASGAGLVFDRHDDVTFAGTFSGDGNVVQAGDGTLTLSADNGGFRGTTLVQQGVLDVAGTLGGTTTVGPGATLTGHGNLGNLVANGTLSPGGPGQVATLTVQGDLSVGSSASYVVDALSDGESDRLAVAGSARLDGGSVLSLSSGMHYDLTTDYTILTAANGLTGTFDHVDNDFAFLTPTLHYDAHDVSLALVRNGVDFSDVGATANQRAVGASLQSLGTGNTYLDVVQMNAPSARAAFDKLSGEVHASAQSALIQDSRYVRDAVNAHLDGDDQGSTVATEHGTVWTSAWGHWGSIAGDGNAAPVRTNGSGVVVGSDAHLGDHAAVGVVVGQSQDASSITDRGSDAHATGTHLGLYGSGEWAGWHVQGGIVAERFDIDTHRTVSLDTLSHVDAHYHGNLAQAFVEGSYRVDLGRGGIAPFVDIAHVRMHTDHWQETGSDVALAGKGADQNTNVAVAGVRGDLFLDDHGTISAHASLSYQQAWSGLTPRASMRFDAGGNAFAIDGVPMARRAALANLGLHAQINNAVSVDATYTGQFLGRNRDQGAKLSLNVAF